LIQPQYVAVALTVAAFATQLVMLGLQAGALRRHRHRSFVLLSVATLCGIAFLVIRLVLKVWAPHAVALISTLYYLSVFCLVLQMILGVWGTASLFKSYRDLASAAGQSRSRR